MPKKSKLNLKKNNTLRVFIGLITGVLILSMLPRTETIEADYSVGMVWGKEDLIAPFTFPVYKSQSVYDKEVEEAKSKVFPLFIVNQDKVNGRINWLDSLNKFLTKLKSTIDYSTELDKESNFPEEKRTTSYQTFMEQKKSLQISFDDKEWNSLLKFLRSNPEAGFEAFKKKLIQSLNQTYSRKIINYSKSNISSDRFSIIRNKIEENIDLKSVNDLDEISISLNTDLRNYLKDNELTSLAVKIAKTFIFADYLYDKDETEKITQAIIGAVPRTFGIVRENERIVTKHEPINESTKLKLESYRKIRNEQMGSTDFYIQNIGRALFVFSLLGLIVIFLFKLRKTSFDDNYKLIIISSIILFQCLLAYISTKLKLGISVEYLVLVPLSAMLITIIFDSRLAFYAVIIICFFVSAIRGGDYDILIPNFAASILVIYSVRDIKNRTQLFVSMFYILLGYVVTILSISMERFDSISVIQDEIISASLNSALSPILAYGMLLFYEKVFGVATDLVYLELSDFNHPLLRELSSKAPGTFHHSMLMGNLSEAAAKEINANQILARVGCYYHDIGKVVSPEYFIENQIDASNKHGDLNPSLSAKMIIAHVKNGIKLAEKYRIPQEIIDFIPMHHGTNLVSYFFEKARNEEGEQDAMHDYIYRYPGPKPQTKETGIVMLADAVEASTRAIDEPTPAKLETQIDEIIKARFLDGELDECDLTLRDLTNIKQSFLKTLVGIHHSRIKYPESNDDKESKS